MAGLEIGAAVFGLIVGTGQTISWIRTTLETTSDVPNSVKAVQASLEEMHIILEGLQQFLAIHGASKELQRSPVPIPRIADTMTGVVMTVSELQKQIDFAQNLTGKIKAFDRGKWWYREKQIEDVRKRVERHKSSLSAMLGILQCHLTQETKQALSQRTDKVTTVYPNIHAQMQLWKHSSSTYPPTAPSEIDTESLYNNEYGYDSLSTAPLSESTISSFRDTQIAISPYRHEFEQILEVSGPYSNIDFAASNPTFTSRIGSERGVAASIFSRRTVETISNIAVYNLPIQPTDLHNGDWYEFKDMRRNATISFVPDIPDRKYGSSLLNRQNSYRASDLDLVGPPGQSHPGDQSSILPKSTFNDNLVDSIFYWYPKSLHQHDSSLTKNPRFVERNDIMTGMQQIANNRIDQMPLILLWGSPGCGKTEIAIEFASNCRKTVSKIQIWMHATDKWNIIDGFSDLAGELGICPSVTRLSPTLEMRLKRARALQQWLGSTDTPWLLVLDDLPNHTAFSDFLPPNNPHGAVLATTRRTFPSKGVPPKWTAIEVGPFNKAQTLSMMNHYEVEGGLQRTPTMVLEFANVADYTPLIVKAFLEYSKERGITALSDYQLSVTSILEKCTMKHGYRTRTYSFKDNTPLYQAWAYELRKLEPYGEYSSDWKMLIRAISFLDTNIFTITLLESILRHLNPKGEKPLLAQTANLVDIVSQYFLSEKFKATGQVQRLSRFSFIMEMAPLNRVEVFSAACSWLASTFPIIPRDPAKTTPPPRFHLEFPDYIRHLHSLTKSFDEFLGTRLSKNFSIDFYVEFLSVLRKSLAYPISAELSKITLDSLKYCRDIYDRITDKLVDEISLESSSLTRKISRYTFYGYYEIDMSMYFRACKRLRLGNRLSAIKFYKAASYAYSQIQKNSTALVDGHSSLPISQYMPALQRLNDKKCFYGIKIAMSLMKGPELPHRPIKYLQDYPAYRDSNNQLDFQGCIYGQSLFLRGNILVTQKKFNNALDKYSVALKCLERCYGGVHPWIGSIQAQIGHIYILLKKWTPAIQFLELALEKYSTGDNVEDAWFVKNRARITFKLFHAYNHKARSENDSNYADLAVGLKEKLDQQALRPGPLGDSWSYYDELVQSWECNPNDCHHIRTVEMS